MSLPVSDLEFDDALDRSWSQFRDGLVALIVALPLDGMVAYVRESTDPADPDPDLIFRRLHDGMVCVVARVDDATATTCPPAHWSTSGPRHLLRLGCADAIDEVVGSALDFARTVWNTTHPTFLRPVSGARSQTGSGRPSARAAAMADHPSGGVNRAVCRVVEQHLSDEIGVDRYHTLELSYPAATAHLQVWESERSALLWTTVSGVMEPDRLSDAREIAADWPDIRLVVDGSVVDVELPIVLDDRPSRAMRAAIEQWHAFMLGGHGALVDALTRPDDEHGAEVSAALRGVLSAHRDHRPVPSSHARALREQTRAGLLSSMDLCRRRSVSWMAWADRRASVHDADGSALACREAQIWDLAYATVSAALRRAVTVGGG